MSDRRDLSTVASALQDYVGRQRLSVIVSLSEDGRQLTAMPTAGRSPPAGRKGLKNPPREAPQGRSFELSVLLRPVADRPRDQRLVLPTQTATSLVLEGDARTGLWTVPGASGDEVVVRLALGKSMTGREANELLGTIDRALASLRGGS